MLDNLERLFYALSDKIRLQIVRILVDHPEVCVCQFQHIFETSQPRISFHLRILREAGLVEGEKRGKWTYYRLGEVPECILQLIKSLPSEKINHYCEVRDEKD